MVHNSKFLELLESNRVFLTEDSFVKGNEKSELPPVGDFEEPEDAPVDQEQPDVDGDSGEEEVTDPRSAKPWDGRELIVLELAMKLFVTYEDDMSKKRDMHRLWDSKRFGDVYSQLTQLDRLNPNI